MTAKQMRTILEICAALSAERDREALLSRILDAAMDLTRCDGGTLYLLGPDGLHFCRMVTRSLGVRQGGHDAPITLPPVPLSASHVCARAVLENRLINVPDVYKSRSFDFSGARRYDAMTGYRTRSVLVAPLTDDRGGLIGVLQLINALTADGRPARFTPGMEPLVTALAAQAAISLTNMQYSEQIAALLDSLVGALSAAIDQRTPYNASHTRSMVKYAVRFLDWLDRTGDPRRFDPDRRRAFLLSVWLHDVGKLTVPLEVMDKADRLGPALERIERRFTEMELLDRIALLEGRLDGLERSARAARRAEALERIRRDNTAGFLPDEEIAALEELAARTYADENGQTRPWLTEDERTSLTVRRGTLTARERAVMEGHVTATARILAQVAFPKQYAQVPVWAADHHELLNGTGYPAHKTAAELPWEVRLLTILDIFDALTARDRPYKPPMPVEKALSVLQSMVREGSLDGEILALFEKSRAWEETT